MAATYRLVVSTVNCYNSIIIDQRFQHTVHYCNGSCKAFPNAAGIDCKVVHHAICSELLSHSSLPSSSLRFAGTQDLTHKFLNAENLAASTDIAADDSHQLLPGVTRVKKGMGTQGLSSLKDITSDAINLASGKIKEFSFEKVKCPASHVTFRKGRKVKPDMTSRRSADFDIIYNHIGSNENCPPFGFAQKTAIEQKETNLITLHEQSISNATQLYLQNLSEDNFIAKFLGKHKADSSDSGEDIRVCLDILLKCSEDLKKCTEIIKQCIKSKSHNKDDNDASNNPDLIYRNVMARLSSYLKKLPFELEHGLSGRGNQHDLAELVNSLHSLQQMPYPPFGNDQPPRYEDVVQSSPTPSTKLPLPVDTQIVHRASNGNSMVPIENVYRLSYNGHLQENGIQQNNSTAINRPRVLPHVSPLNCSESSSSQDSFLSRSIDSTSKIPMELLYIQEDCDVDKVLKQESRGNDYFNFGMAEKNPQPQKPASPADTCKRAGDNGIGIRDNMGENRLCVQPASESQSFSNNVSRSHNSTEPSITRSKTKTENDKATQQDDIEKLLMDLESFSQTINTRQEYDSSRNNDIDLKNYSQRSGQVNFLTTESGSKHLEVSLRETVPLSSPTKGTNVNKNNKNEEDDAALLLRILESIEGFAQELVERGSNKGILAREKEVMRILQDTLSQASESCKTAHSIQPVVPKDNGSHLSVQQTPEVIKVQSNKEKKPGTPPPTVTNTTPSPPPPSNKVVVSTPVSINIPRFYFPKGLPSATNNHEEIVAKVQAAFAEFEDEKADIYEMGKITKACGCPLYWKAPMFISAGGERTGFASVHSCVAMWRKVLQSCHDDASKFVYLLAKPGCNYLEQEDFIPLLQDIVDTHPGLTFLKDAPEFHSRYITTVIQRIFYTVNRSWSGKITLTELRKSNFLQTLVLLEEEDDINQITDYFSYEHFYVIYCKFWELDTDHDLFIDQKDLARHNDHAISNRIIERIFSGAVTRGNCVQKEGRMSYADFVWFLLSEEDKKNPTSMEYWFRAMDIDGDGVLSMYELEYFYEEQCERMEGMGIEPLPFHDLLCQLLDLVKPECEGKITMRDLKRCRMAHIFYDTCFNLEKYLDHEQRDPFAVQKDIDSEGPEPSDWDKYAAEEYEILVAEESANEQLQEGSFEEDYESDELSTPELSNKMDKLVISDLPT
ncbi:serine/threonine-protein phosphatase 2A regulatory subunit B'' subunit alpha isoform X1 [Carcharodon carcharias]|uniref:serine/threonine-protein phosphatase 2A regulatory subunit B'' subunit alpha isoform X1 n=1 Tax=Carcharodon carcharias TaxID=13397 RepID=UPI001B7E2486|nr:serine/threonine-protein phosphatase 2A regulatory subunit B'' subunit alpha isoform X1 [Carcharodon carcharias]XP_041029145.1 serine/threonine-protein phosphatase 2A regulatory subunit B'' subunit alpha isoform X1 [Carcharodon carcharias]